MTHAKKTFGQHIEDGLTFMGDGIYNAVQTSKDHELEYLKAGLIPDEEKLRVLKRDLYQAARGRGDSEYIANLTRAIATISQQIEEDRGYRDSLPQTIYGILNSLLLTAMLATFFSFPAAWVCGVVNSRSQFCQVSRVIPSATIKFFTEPSK